MRVTKLTATWINHCVTRPSGIAMRQSATPVDFSCHLVRLGARQWYR
jgi:hypothetical protein